VGWREEDEEREGREERVEREEEKEEKKEKEEKEEKEKHCRSNQKSESPLPLQRNPGLDGKGGGAAERHRRRNSKDPKLDPTAPRRSPAAS